MMNRLLFALCALILMLSIAHACFAADTLCPQDSADAKTVPGDVAGVQADIDRLDLCVERAKLLKQLDDLAKARSDTLHKMTDPNFSSNNLTGGVSGIAPLPLAALPELPVVKASDLKPGEKRVNASGASPFGNDASAEAKSLVEAKPTWKVRKVWGQAGGVAGASMRAQLSDGKGSLLNVTKGDPLPDGSIVDSVSVKGVTLLAKDPKGLSKVDTLSWDESADSLSGGSSISSPADKPLQ